MAQQRTVSDDVSGSNVAASAGLGVLAAAISYLVSYVLIVDEARDVFGDSVADWQSVAWYFYNAHMVDLETTGTFGGLGGSGTVDLIAESSATSATVLYAIPPLVLLGIGALLAVQLGARDLGEAVVAGAPVTIGYAVVMGLGAVATEASAEGSFFGIEASGSIAPELVPAILLGGILYPLVFATAGAVLATSLAGR
ncbi:hypothetical protein [Natronolimnohabitans innermongolicus]|uniref:DUF7978 domain-containing protein n=1 Tax=Natronolimnohabitans innermongolicus JCM 12255 TaxID=1227499 RepID=L9WYG6_9EURY|nr:hypothetical protein [Natronolimnohabitans innermongolicus]ELY54462.1 hypothetical protein C493_12649 [Natronolimnohabitans innermongolicus JCM 12255]